MGADFKNIYINLSNAHVEKFIVYIENEWFSIGQVTIRISKSAR